MSSVDVETFRAPATPAAITTHAAAPRGQRSETFLAGGAPMWWLRASFEAGKAALATGVALWFARGLRRGSPGTIRVNAALRRQMGLSNDTARRGLHALATAGLVSIARGGRGRCTEVEIVTERPSSHESAPVAKEGT